MKILGIPGSVRPNSFNKRFLDWIGLVINPMGAEVSVLEISEIPVAIGGRSDIPPEVAKAKKLIEKSDGIIFSTPQYNYTFPQVLKNTIDWIAFPETQNSLRGKKGYVVGVSMDSTGVIKAEGKLKEYLTGLGMQMYEGEPITIDRAAQSQVFDDQGGLIDKDLEKKSKETLAQMVAWLKK